MTHILRTAGAVIVCLLAFQSPAQEADKPDPRYTWDLAAIYPSVEAWNEARDEVLEQFEAIEARRGKLGDSADDLYRTLRLVSDTSRQAARVSTYAASNAFPETVVSANIIPLERFPLWGMASTLPPVFVS